MDPPHQQCVEAPRSGRSPAGALLQAPAPSSSFGEWRAAFTQVGQFVEGTGTPQQVSARTYDGCMTEPISPSPILGCFTRAVHRDFPESESAKISAHQADID